MTVYILSVLLLLILAFAVVQLSRKSEVEAEIKKLKKRNQLSLITELRSAEKVVWLCFAGGLLLTANYAITYFSGAELKTIATWGFIQWSGALIGLVIAVSITFVQKVLYSSPTHSKAGLIVTTLVLVFVIISEIGSPIEKEGMKMKSASQDSAVFKAVIGQIQGGTNTMPHYSSQIATATAEKAQHEFELKRCERHQSKGEKRVQRCEDYENGMIMQAQAKINSYQSTAIATTSSNESSRLALIQQAKSLERNTDNHSELVKLTASVLGANFLASIMFLSLVLIVAFEAGFHFVGSRVGILKATLGEMGNKEILRKQELSSLKKEKHFKDESAYINPDNDLNITPASPSPQKTIPPKVKTDLNPTKQTIASHLVVKAGETTSSGSEAKERKTKTNSNNHLENKDFDDLYHYLKQQIETGKMTLSLNNLRKMAHKRLKDNPAIENASMSIPKTGQIVEKIKDRMLDEKFITLNPNFSNGKAKYLLA